MKKITRASIEMLKEKLPVLKDEEQKEIIGAAFVYDISGHFITGTVEYGNQIRVIDINGVEQPFYSAGYEFTNQSVERIIKHIVDNGSIPINYVNVGPYYPAYIIENNRPGPWGDKEKSLFITSGAIGDNGYDFYRVQSYIKNLYDSTFPNG